MACVPQTMMAARGWWISLSASRGFGCSLRPVRGCNLQFVRTKFRQPDSPLPDPYLAKRLVYGNRPHVEREQFPGEYATDLPRGKIYDKKPMRLHLEAGKQYLWCICGTSKGQPMCDGSHKRLDGTEFVKTHPIFRPVPFTVDVSGDYYLCNCKRSSNMPYCDGTHRRKDIQEAVKS